MPDRRSCGRGQSVYRQLPAVVLAFLIVPLLGVGSAQEVKTAAGLVKGTTVADGAVKVFSGIPYAAPPVGDLRWRPPQPVTPWQGVKDATVPGAACMQGKVFDDISFPQLGEDCLTVNVYTPAKAERLPVMVWIHGGGFYAGGGPEPRHDGQAFARKGIVLVTINYRLGVFGFLAHPELTKESAVKASGNYGLLDQVAALRWVKDNIAAFGGDPGNVTIFGESAGSFAVSALMASPLAKGLFHKAIGESGAFFSTTLGPTPLAAAEQQGADVRHDRRRRVAGRAAGQARPGRARRGGQVEAALLAHHRRALPAEGRSRHLRGGRAGPRAAARRVERRRNPGRRHAAPESPPSRRSRRAPASSLATTRTPS